MGSPLTVYKRNADDLLGDLRLVSQIIEINNEERKHFEPTAGSDILCPDSSKSIHRTGGVIIELHARTGFYTHLYPTIGRQNNVVRKVMKATFS